MHQLIHQECIDVSVSRPTRRSGTGENFYDSHDLSYELEAGTRYAFGWCTNDDVYAYYATTPSGSNDLAWATYDGWAAGCSGVTDDGDCLYLRFTVEAADADGDGSDSIDDCDDGDASIHPDAEEIYYDGIDQACDGGDDYDADDDGYTSDVYGGDDCDDSASDVHPGADDRVYDGVDADCRGDTDYDQDGDGGDSDRFGGTDCDDTDGNINTGAREIWYDGVDQDCDGGSDYDQDQDGHDAQSAGGDDCNDADPAVAEDCTAGTDDGVDTGTDDGTSGGGDDKGCGGKSAGAGKRSRGASAEAFCGGGSPHLACSATRPLGRRAMTRHAGLPDQRSEAAGSGRGRRAWSAAAPRCRACPPSGHRPPDGRTARTGRQSSALPRGGQRCPGPQSGAPYDPRVTRRASSSGRRL